MVDFSTNYTNRSTIFDGGDTIQGHHVKSLYDWVGKYHVNDNLDLSGSAHTVSSTPAILLKNLAAISFRGPDSANNHAIRLLPRSTTPNNNNRPQLLFGFTGLTAPTNFGGNSYEMEANPNDFLGVYGLTRGADFRFWKATASDDRPAVLIQRDDAVLASTAGSSVLNNEANCALKVTSVQQNGSGADMQCNAIFAFAQGNASTGHDAVGIWATGDISSTGAASRIATGGYFEGRSRRSGTGSGGVIAVEIRAANLHTTNQASDAVSTTNGASKFTGLWVTPEAGGSANQTLGDGIGVGLAFAGQRWSAGLSFKESSIVDRTISDYSSSNTCFYASGAHTYGLNFDTATFSGSAIRLPNNTNGRITWDSAFGSADVWPIYVDNNDQLVFGQNGTIIMGNGSGVQQLFTWTTGGLRIGTASNELLSFWGATPVARQADIGALTMTVGTADGTVADVGAAFNQTTLNNNFRDLGEKINSIRTLLRTVGFMA